MLPLTFSLHPESEALVQQFDDLNTLTQIQSHWSRSSLSSFLCHLKMLRNMCLQKKAFVGPEVRKEVITNPRSERSGSSRKSSSLSHPLHPPLGIITKSLKHFLHIFRRIWASRQFLPRILNRLDFFLPTLKSSQSLFKSPNCSQLDLWLCDRYNC